MKKHLAIMAAAVLLTACAGTKLNADGSPKGDLHWPDPKKVAFEKGKGTFPNLENLGNVRPGMSRDQLYDLLGRPHFTEGFHVREWNYLFYFNTPGQGTDGVSTCVYKVLFDKDLVAQHYYWNAVDPTDGVCPPTVKKQGSYSLSADALFAFDRSDLQSVNAQGRAELDHLAQELKQFSEINAVSVSGHTDRLGDEAYNQALSQARADSVRDYLIAAGLPAEKISAQGMGESSPVKSCAQQNRRALIDCLAPNRRVEVKVDGYGVIKP